MSSAEIGHGVEERLNLEWAPQAAPEVQLGRVKLRFEVR